MISSAKFAARKAYLAPVSRLFSVSIETLVDEQMTSGETHQDIFSLENPTYVSLKEAYPGLRVGHIPSSLLAKDYESEVAPVANQIADDFGFTGRLFLTFVGNLYFPDDFDSYDGFFGTVDNLLDFGRVVSGRDAVCGHQNGD